MSYQNLFKHHAKKLGMMSFFLGLPLLFPATAISAEEIFISYGPLDFSLSVESLEIYANEGRITKEFATYANFLEPEQLKSLQNLLVQPADLNVVAISQFFYSPQGQTILQELGKIIQTKAGQNGFYALRSALILAAADQEGLTLLNVLKKFPTYGIRINSQRGLEVFRDLNQMLAQTEGALAFLQQQSLIEAYNFPLQESLPDLRIEGNIPVTQEQFIVKDSSRRREFPAIVYLPQLLENYPLPLIIISHGLGSDLDTFEYLAKHLASHGFAVAILEHPGSNADQIQGLLTGLEGEVTPPQELIDRPLDIKYLLNQLEINFSESINTKKVGIIGQSFGAYTALTLVGAQINLEELSQHCPPLQDSLNISLLLQCLGLNAQLPPSSQGLQDERIVAVMAINPFTSILLGKSQLSRIQVPVMFVSGGADTVTPAFTEQIKPFTWLETMDKYLVLIENSTHFSTLGESVGSTENASIPVPSQAIGPNPLIAQTYVKALSLAFLKTHLTQEQTYQSYLNAAYAQSISEELMPLYFLEEFNSEKLEKLELGIENN